MWPTSLSLPQHADELLAVGAAFRPFPGITVSLSPGRLLPYSVVVVGVRCLAVVPSPTTAALCAGAYVTPGNGSFVVDNAIAQMYRVTQASDG